MNHRVSPCLFKSEYHRLKLPEGGFELYNAEEQQKQRGKRECRSTATAPSSQPRLGRWRPNDDFARAAERARHATRARDQAIFAAATEAADATFDELERAIAAAQLAEARLLSLVFGLREAGARRRRSQRRIRRRRENPAADHRDKAPYRAPR